MHYIWAWDVSLTVAYLPGPIVLCADDRMAKISSVFLALSVFGGAVLVCLFVHSTLLRGSNPGYGHVLEPRRERDRQHSSSRHKFTIFSLKSYNDRSIDNKPAAHLMRLDHPPGEGRGGSVTHRNMPGDPPSRSKQHVDSKGGYQFLNSHNRLRFWQLVQGETELDAAVELSTRFPFRSDFSFPQPKVMRSLEYISRASWVTDLRYYLSTYNYSREISLVTSNYKYTDVLVNWLISATVRSKIPMKSILVISLDATVHRLMLAKQFCSILVPPWTLIAKGVNFSQPFESVMMTRLAVMRIINHFGYDFVMYDSDAVILKDPQPLYDVLPHEDIVGSVGKIPYDLASAWGITICIGVVLVRSSPKTGKGMHAAESLNYGYTNFIFMVVI